MTTQPINPDFNSYVRNTDFKGDNKQMPNIESTEEGNVFYELDEDGNRVRLFRDSDKDGNIDVISNLDSDGKVVDEIIDENGDGKADIHVSYEYDKDGNEIARRVDLDMDGNTDVTQYVDESIIYSDDIDTDDNGSVDIHVNYTYDEEGNEYRTIDDNLDGKPNVISTVNSAGEVVSEEVDTYGNGEIDTHVEYTTENGETKVSSERGMKPIEGNLPEGWTVSDGKILNANGEEVGRVVTEILDSGIKQLYFEYLE